MASKTSRSSRRRKRPTRRRTPRKRARESRPSFLAIWVGLMVVVGSIWLGYALWSGKLSRDRDLRPKQTPVPSARQMKVTLYFSDDQAEFLIGEPRNIASGNEPISIARAVMEALIKGPRSGLQPTIPRDTQLLKVAVERGVCTVDFSEAIQTNHSGGTSGELMTVYSIVTTLTENVPGVQSVRILIEGRPQETLAGHLYIGVPLELESRYIGKSTS